MASLNDIKSSKYLKKEDVGEGVLVTIESLKQENIAKEGAEPEYKWALHLRELEKPLILNSTNAQIIAQITGHENDIETKWIGTQIVLYTDPNITFQGKLVGGVRVRAPKSTQKPDLPF